MNQYNRIIYLMGVSGSGKSTIGRLLSKKTGIPFFDGDDFHPQENVDKMKAGIPLTDEDRYGWLKSLRQHSWGELQKKGAIYACSALKEQYRTILEDGLGTSVNWVYLHGDREILLQRLNHRKDHFFPPELLDSQLATLEVPQHALIVSVRQTPEVMVHKIIKGLGLVLA